MNSPPAPIRWCSAALALAVVLAATGCANHEELGEDGLPRQLVWTTYGTGTSTYADVAAVADAITTHEGSPVRVITSDTAIGRLAPLREGPAHFSRTGDEYVFSFEGDEDFTTELWGPQDVRVVWAPVAPHGLLVDDDSGIENIEDLRGADFPYITANPSVNDKLEAFLANAGLTWGDVNPVEVGYGEQPDALRNGLIDVLFQQVHGSSLYELESAFDVRWLSPDTDPESLANVLEVSPSVELGEFEGAPGQEEGESDTGMIYTLPVVTYADTDPELVRHTIETMVENFEHYEDSTATLPSWSADEVLTAPKEVPFHDGLVEFLEERGDWRPEADELNEDLVERGERLRELWPEVAEQDDPRATWPEVKADVPRPDPHAAEQSTDDGEPDGAEENDDGEDR
ncbi:TAXI family TRAP transporter solute-binding subunit [Nocardiopsis salina]|uniref:TAXI family TRAP transporter solute-binding subunit n=1 Tax=Nocardiopsis salina TaxID=245836 RepID=UPI0003496171|nr:TAXI family TRAP transporter solute-binding subunit [Nocardiopsis salina]